MTRRMFLGEMGAGILLSGCQMPFGTRERVPYDATIGDRLWMWGHHRDSFKSMKGSTEQYNLPFDTRIDMAAACRQMNIPGCFVVRWRNLPVKADLSDYMRQFESTKRIGFSITDSAVESFDEKVAAGFELADRMPNLTTFIMDDFFSYKGESSEKVGKLAALKEKLTSRGMRLSVVLYADANGVKTAYKRVLDYCDEITFWFWHGKSTNAIIEQTGKLRDLVGNEKPVLLGQYMWDFGGKKPMPGATMENQLAQTSQLLKEHRIQGVIFHCTPLVDMDLDAVRVSKAWIRENGNKLY